MGDVPPAYPTKADLLTAASRGDMADMANAQEDTPAFKAVAASLAAILANEFRTPIFDDRKTGYCRMAIKGSMPFLIRDVTSQALSNQAASDSAGASLFSELNRNMLKSIRQTCTPLGAAPQRIPAVDSLEALVREYGEATLAFANRQRAEAAAAKEQAEKQHREAADRQAAQRRADEQRRIDVERKRIEAEQQAKKQRDATRVGG
jgi:hypothetical protein